MSREFILNTLRLALSIKELKAHKRFLYENSRSRCSENYASNFVATWPLVATLPLVATWSLVATWPLGATWPLVAT